MVIRETDAHPANPMTDEAPESPVERDSYTAENPRWHKIQDRLGWRTKKYESALQIRENTLENYKKRNPKWSKIQEQLPKALQTDKFKAALAEEAKKNIQALPNMRAEFLRSSGLAAQTKPTIEALEKKLSIPEGVDAFQNAMLGAEKSLVAAIEQNPSKQVSELPEHKAWTRLLETQGLFGIQPSDTEESVRSELTTLKEEQIAKFTQDESAARTGIQEESYNDFQKQGQAMAGEHRTIIEKQEAAALLERKKTEELNVQLEELRTNKFGLTFFKKDTLAQLAIKFSSAKIDIEKQLPERSNQRATALSEAEAVYLTEKNLRTQNAASVLERNIVDIRKAESLKALAAYFQETRTAINQSGIDEHSRNGLLEKAQRAYVSRIKTLDFSFPKVQPRGLAVVYSEHLSMLEKSFADEDGLRRESLAALRAAYETAANSALEQLSGNFDNLDTLAALKHEFSTKQETINALQSGADSQLVLAAGSKLETAYEAAKTRVENPVVQTIPEPPQTKIDAAKKLAAELKQRATNFFGSKP